MIEFTPTRTSTASIETLFDVMTDHRGLVHTTWMFRRTTLEGRNRGAERSRRDPTPRGDRTPIHRRDCRVRATHTLGVHAALRRTNPRSPRHNRAARSRHRHPGELASTRSADDSRCRPADAAGLPAVHRRTPQGRYHHRRAPCRRCMSVQIRQPELFWGAAPIGLDTSASVGCGTHAVGLHAVRDLIGVATQLHRCSPKRRGLRGHRAR